MSPVQRIAQLFGIVFVLVAILGFVAAGSSLVADPATAPKILGLFPVNLLHNLVHLVFGIWGLLAARTLSGAAAYGRIGGIIYLVLAALALVSPSLFGLVPIGGHDIWLHALLGIVLAGAGFTARTAPSRATM